MLLLWIRRGAVVRKRKLNPRIRPVPAGKPKTAESETKSGTDDRRSATWVKRILAMAGAIVTIGGAVTVIAQFTHWLDFVVHASASTCSSSSSPGLEVSPLLGISFHQN